MNWNASARALLEELRPVALNRKDAAQPQLDTQVASPEVEPEVMTTALFGWS
jgi:hypothetical protein